MCSDTFDRVERKRTKKKWIIRCNRVRAFGSLIFCLSSNRNEHIQSNSCENVQSKNRRRSRWRRGKIGTPQNVKSFVWCKRPWHTTHAITAVCSKGNNFCINSSHGRSSRKDKSSLRRWSEEMHQNVIFSFYLFRFDFYPQTHTHTQTQIYQEQVARIDSNSRRIQCEITVSRHEPNEPKPNEN